MGRPQKRQRKSGGVIQKIPSTASATVIRVGELCDDEHLKSSGHQRLLGSHVTLDQLLAPLDEQIFLAQCFRTCAVHIPALDPDRIEGLCEQLFDLDAESILRSTSSDNIFVWLRSEDGLIQSIEVSDADTALALYQIGHATYCRAPPPVERHLVSSLLADTGLGCGQYDPTGESTSSLGRGEVEVFMSSPGHKTDWHFDFQENFTVQLSGVKRWTLQKGTVKHPIRGCTPHYRSPESVEPQLKAAHLSDPGFEFNHPVNGVNAVGGREEVLVHPGDVLYFPAGMWHCVEVLEPGVSINISLMAMSYATVTTQALQHLLLKKDEWRASVCHNSATDALGQLKSLLRALPGIIEEFEREGGAEAIIPPAVRRGATLPIDGEGEDEDEAEDDLIDIDSGNQFLPEVPSEGELRAKLETHRLVMNPLASLLREDEIFKFYKTGEDDDPVDDEQQTVFVLNVNYAGNEAHESAIRKRIMNSGMLLQHVHASAKAYGASDLLPCLPSWIENISDRTMLSCLVHYGCLLWVPRV